MKKLEDKKIALVSLGCDKNLMDSEVMLGLLQEAGAVITVDEELADAVIINTCGFVMSAVDESVETIMRALSYKQNEKNTAVIVAGCAAQRYSEDIFEEIPGVDAVVGTSDFEGIVDIVKNALDNVCSYNKKKSAKGIKNACHVSDIGEGRTITEESLLKRIVSTPSYYAFIKIAEGCDNHCTYCSIPSIRGKLRSREMDALVKEAEMLVAGGVKELVVVAQDTAVYGKDLYGEPKLHSLLRKLSEVEGLEWIRVMYCYPEHIYDDLITEFAENEKVCKYIDMPIQHSEDNVLKRMGRKSTKDGLKEIIQKLRESIPGVVLRTTVITGFPGETKKDFAGLHGFIKEIRFDKLGVFAYSREEGTPADKLSGHLSENTKRGRMNTIMEEQQKISAEKCLSLVGKTLNVLVCGAVPYEKKVYFGRSYADAPDIDGVVYIQSENQLTAGEFVDLKVSDAVEYDLIGEI